MNIRNFFTDTVIKIQNIYKKSSRENKILYIIFTLVWLVSFVAGFFLSNWTIWMIWTAITYMLIYFILLEADENFFLIPIWILTIIKAIVIWLLIYFLNGQWLIAWWFVLWLASIYSIYYSLVDLRNNRIKFAVLEYFQWWAGLFTILFTLSIVLTRIGQHATFTLTCDQLQKESNIVISSITDSILPSKNSEETPTQTQYAIVNYIYWLKKDFIDSTLDQQSQVNKKICQTVIDQVSELYAKPGFKLSVIALLLVLISPLLRITIYIILVLSLMIFYIWKRLWKYKIKKITKEIDYIDVW